MTDLANATLAAIAAAETCIELLEAYDWRTASKAEERAMDAAEAEMKRTQEIAKSLAREALGK